MDLLIDQIILVVLVPALISGAIYYFRYLFTEKWQGTLFSLAAPFAFVISYVSIFKDPKLWPLTALSLLFVTAILAFPLSYTIKKLKLDWISLDAVVTFSLASLIVHSGLSIYSMFSGSASLAQLMGVYCATLGPFLVISFLRKRERREMRLFPYIDLMSLGFLYVFYTYIEFESYSFVWCYIPYFVAGLFLFVGKQLPTLTKAFIILITSVPPIGFVLYKLYKISGPLY